MKDIIAENLDLEPMVISTNLHDYITVNIPDDTLENDKKKSRETLYKMLSTGEAALGQSMAMLQDVPSPRSVEVITGLIKAMSEISQDLIKIHPTEVKEEKVINNTNVAFTGTVSTLLDNIKDD